MQIAITHSCPNFNRGLAKPKLALGQGSATTPPGKLWCIYLTYPCPAWWRHQIEKFSTLLALCEGNTPVTGGFPSQRPVTRSFGVFYDLRLNKRLSKQSRRRWFWTSSRSLWRHCNACPKHTDSAWLKLISVNKKWPRLALAVEILQSCT